MVKHNRSENLAKNRKEIRQTISQASMVFYVAASHEEIVRYHSTKNHFIGSNEYHDEFILISGLRNHYLLRFNQNEEDMQFQFVVQQEKASRQHLENILYLLPNDSSSFVSLLVDTLRSSEEGHLIYREGNNRNRRGVLKKAQSECSSTFMEIDVNSLSKCLRETTAKFTRRFHLEEFNAQDENQKNYIFE